MNHIQFENEAPHAFPYDACQELDTAPSRASKSLLRDLLGRLRALPYRALLLLVAQLLERQGSQNVQFAGRDGFVGRNQGGGWDLEATLPPHQSFASSHLGVRSLIQVKQFGDLAVQQRTVDELRGCCLRAGAGQGLLVTTSRFSPVAVRAAAASALAPIALINGEDLLDLLAQQGMGVIRAMSGQLHLDPEFFQSLEAKADALREEKATAPASAKRHRRTNTSTESSLASRSSAATMPLTPLESKPHRRQTTVLHFSVTLDARPGDSGTRKRTKAQ